MKTIFLLLAQYDGKAMLPIETVQADYFPHLSLPKFLRKLSSGEIDLPMVRSEASQKSAKFVHMEDLAKYIEARHASALKEANQMRAAA
jgi:hypothetical protein